MLSKLCKLFIGFLCGLLFIEWFPVSSMNTLTDIFAACIVKPLHFFASSIVFIIGFFMNAEVMGEVILFFANLCRIRRSKFIKLLLGLFMMVNFTVLFYISFWQTAVFFCFSLLYGIISIDFKNAGNGII